MDSKLTFTAVTQLTNQQKWIVAIFTGILFAIISSPLVYGVTNKLFASLNVGPLTTAGGPTTTGLLIHTVVFILVSRLVMM